MKKILIIILLSFLVACIQLEESRDKIIKKDIEKKEETTEDKKHFDAKKELLELLNKHNSLKEYSAEFETEIQYSKDKKIYQNTKLFFNNNKLRTDGIIKIVEENKNKSEIMEEERTRITLNNNTYFECIYDNEWLCTKTELNDEELHKILFEGKDDQYISIVEKAKVEFTKESEYLGEKTSCFTIDLTEECYLQDTGLLASSKSQSSKAKLLNYSLNAEESLFNIPKN